MDVGENMIIAGIGCRRQADARDIKAAIETAMREWLPGERLLNAIAIPASKSEASAVFTAARALGVGVLLISQPALNEASPRTFTRSARSLAEMNVRSVSEAAALAGAGTSSRLLGPRIVLGPVTCALAESGSAP
jgi:cobalt-precorrin 5A hydrolase